MLFSFPHTEQILHLEMRLLAIKLYNLTSLDSLFTFSPICFIDSTASIRLCSNYDAFEKIDRDTSGYLADPTRLHDP